MSPMQRALGPTFALILALASAGAAQQQPRAMKIVDMLDLPSVSDPQLSPDGQQVVFVRSQADWKANHRVSHLWRTDVSSGQTVQITSGETGERDPAWSPDGKWLAFVARRGGDEESQIYLLPSEGGEAHRLTHHASSVSSLTWSPDGKSIYFVAAEPKTAEEKAREKAKDDVFEYDENYKQEHIWRASLPDGAETRVTGGDFSVNGYKLSSDGRKIAFQRAPNPLYGYADQGEVWVMDADGGNAVQLTKNTVTEGDASLSPDNSQVLFTCGCNDKFETYYNSKVFVEPASGGQARRLFGDLPYEIRQAEWSPDGKSIYFVANMGVHSELFVGDVATGKTRQLTDGEHSMRGWAMEPKAGVHVVTLDQPDNAGDVYLVPLAGGQAKQVTHVFDRYAQEFRLPKQEKITWKGKDGVTVEGLLFYPLDYKPGTRYPLVVQSHGGPQASDQFGFGRWSTFTPVLTGMGYAVLQTNYRGSTGYGDDFLRDMVNHYYKNAHLDVLAGVDKVIAMGVADPDRLATMGWSAGGHMTDWLITFTDRFKAASSGAGAANWISMYAQSDVRSYRTPWFGGTPWQKDAPIDRYWDNSPIKYVSNVKTPTIFLVGQQDPRVPMPQSVEMYRALTSLGVPTHLYVAPREPHGWQELRHELTEVNADLAWFEKWVTKRDYTWEKAPGEEKATAGVSAQQR